MEKSFIITGVASGLGACVAKSLTENGLKVIGRKCLEAKGGFLDIGNDFFVLYLSAVTSDLKSCFDFNEFLSSL